MDLLPIVNRTFAGAKRFVAVGILCVECAQSENDVDEGCTNDQLKYENIY